MPLQRPNFDVHKYDCLKPDLSGVRAFVGAEDINRQIELKLASKDALLRAPPQGGDLLNSLIADIKGLTLAHRNRPARMKALCDEYQAACAKGKALAAADGRKAQSLRAIVSMYAAFNEVEFRREFNKEFGEAGPGIAAAVQAIEEDIAKLQEAAKEAWPSDPEVLCVYFRNETIPERWREYGIRDTFSDCSMATMIMESFLRDWRDRSARFGPPVTINGLLIKSLPTKMQQTWQELYGFLRLGELPKRIYYEPLTADHTVTDRVEETVPSELPEVFQKRGRGRPRKES